MKDEKAIEKIVSKLRCDELTGASMNRGYTDGFDTHYVLLAQEIFYEVKEYLNDEAVKKLAKAEVRE